MASGATGRVALMSIHPHHADAILAGEKLVEFRKRALAPDVETVLLYATSPVRAVVGWFTVGGTIKKNPKDLWQDTQDVGGISRTAFEKYYSGCEEAVGLLIEDAERLTAPIPLSKLDPRPAVPQSFNYVSGTVLSQVTGAV